MAIARHRTSRQTRWLAQQSPRSVEATTVCTSTWTREPTTTTRAPSLSLSASLGLIGRFWSALHFYSPCQKIVSFCWWAAIEKKQCLVLKVSQIECDSTSLPWQGCLQYYMGIEGWAFYSFLCFAKKFYFLFSCTLNCMLAFVSLFLLLLWPLEPSAKCTRSTVSVFVQLNQYSQILRRQCFLLWSLKPSAKCTPSTTSSRTTICKTNTTTSASDRRTTCAGGADEDLEE